MSSTPQPLSSITTKAPSFTPPSTKSKTNPENVPQKAIPTFHSCVFVEATELVPKHWATWFWSLISEGAPFSWGDNNRTMVTASDFHDHCQKCLSDCEEVSRNEINAFFCLIASLNDTYIDLEN